MDVKDIKQLKDIHILFVDDDEDERLFFTIAATSATDDFNINVQALEDGVLMLEHLSDKKSKLPNIVFLDINMPRKTGLECLQELRNFANCKNLPVVIYTTSGSESEMQVAKKYGADMFIKKPNTLPQLKEVIRYTLSIDWASRVNGNRQFESLGI